ncbi:hypothetical protein R5H30_02130 [Sulfitobacter sp. D35]|uniref:hypothetical protein n=1 Tax=Sulfitobacter sp. D35 TaxID=3083252 RepID=UPI00296FFF6B|nr:hypothetical protein [Sulfitobacter sp. D35]MDW4496763.1 hypothetical protein [Sulfitobacter sp. D35]
MPRTTVAALIGLILQSTAVFSDTTGVVTQDDLRTAIYAGDIDAVEAELGKARSAFEAGDLDEDGMRHLFEVFAVTHPDVSAFTRDWLDAEPSSPLAMAARAWVLHTAGWIVRGDKYLQDTHPEAMENHSRLHHEAMQLARMAYEADPDLIPASDAVVMLANTGGDKNFAFEVFQQTMERMPNWGTVTRAFGFAHPGYGGSYEIGEALCDHYATKVDIGDRDAAAYCRIQWLVDKRQYQNWPAMALAMIEELDDDPWLEPYRFIAQLNNHPMSRADAERVRDQVEAEGFESLHWAKYYDYNVGHRWGFELQTDRTLEHAKVRALAALEHDPYNPVLLDTVIQQSYRVKRTEVRNGDQLVEVELIKTPIRDLPSRDEKIAFMKRKLVVAPYDPENWKELARELKHQSVEAGREGTDLVRWDRYRQNAVYYGMHRIDHLESFAEEKIWQLAQFTEVPAIVAGANGWDSAVREIDRNSKLVCPIVRLGILMTAVREYQGLQSRFDPAMQAVVDGLTTEVEENGACHALFDAALEDLAYEAVPLDVLDLENPFSDKGF